MPITILLVDDHSIVRDGLKAVLESHDDFRVIGEAGNGCAAVEQAIALQPEIVLMDVAMPELNGIEATRIISGQVPAAKIIMLSMHHAREHIYHAMRVGAHGYLFKESAGNDVVQAIRAVMKGQHFFCSGARRCLDDLAGDYSIAPKSPLESLSIREHEVMQHVVEGKTSAEIALLLSLSPKTVETYRSRLMLKLGLKNIPELVRYALVQGITPAS